MITLFDVDLLFGEVPPDLAHVRVALVHFGHVVVGPVQPHAQLPQLREHVVDIVVRHLVDLQFVLDVHGRRARLVQRQGTGGGDGRHFQLPGRG